VVRHHATAEDLLQEVYLALTRACAKGEDIADLPAWCRGVGRNLALKGWRSQRRATVVVDSALLARLDQAFTERDAEDDLERRRSALAACRERLPQHADELLRKRYGATQPVADIATDMGRTPAAVMMALSRLRRELADCVMRRLRAEETA
jgi:RNA polymerase sigma-70 factor (ECF subfamily)